MTLEQAKSALLKLADGAMYVAKDTGRNQTAVAGKTVRRSF
jgi:PleD family two-component response regulator